MRLSQYVKPIIVDIFKACGCLLIAAAIYLELNAIEIVEPLFLWQIIIIASAYTLFKAAFLNQFDLGGKYQLISFMICSTLANMLVILWLYLVSPNADNSIIIAYIIVILLVKGTVFAMMYIDGEKQAKEINEKLTVYKNTEGK